MKSRRIEAGLLKSAAARLKEVRKSRGITQQIAGFDTRYNIGKIEASRTNISVSTLYILGKYYEISLEESLRRMEQV
ncbi:hypothetical protein FACS1894159_02270 [Bacteroidia bacterium]|nr:hypothetical protein FACS1894159_02270 [Bacteroidia bacterium]